MVWGLQLGLLPLSTPPPEDHPPASFICPPSLLSLSPHPACLLTHRVKLAFLFWAARGAKWPSLSGRDYVRLSDYVRKVGKVRATENVPQDTSAPDLHLPLLSLWASQTPVHTGAVKVFHRLASGDGRQQSWGICP